jgi:hypothetical protein
MKTLSIFKFQFTEATRSLTVFFGIMLLILAFMSVSISGSAEVGGMETASVIFIFVVGLNSFKSAFNFSLANGVSRKTQFVGHLATTAVLAAILVLGNSLLNLIFSNFVPYSSLYAQLYFQNSPFSYTDNLWSGPIWFFLLYFTSAVLGYMICLIYYRSGLAMKLVVSIAPPIFLFIVLPYLAMLYPETAHYWSELVGSAFGLYQAPDPYRAMQTFFVSSLLFNGAGFMLMRRAQVKK